MAVLTSLTFGADTTDQASIATSNQGATRWQLTALLVGCSDLAPNPNQVVITNNNTGVPKAPGFVPAARAVFRGGLDSLMLFVGAGLEPNTLSRVYTITLPAAATGIFYSELVITGMKRTGLAAIRQISSIQNNAAAGIPAPTFPVACLPDNAVLIALGNGTSSPGLTVTGFTLANNTGYATPTTGFMASVRNSGFTGVTPVFTTTSVTEFGAFAVEFDTTDYTSNDGPQIEAGIGV